jgi:hypothetical protein
MNTTQEKDKPELLDMHLDYDGGNTLHEAVRWSKFLSITMIAGIGLLLIFILIGGPVYVLAYGSLSPDGAGIIWATLAGFVLYLGAWVGGGIVLLRFSLFARRGMDYQDQVVFNRGLKSLKITFIIFAIVSIVSLLVTIFTIINRW